MLVLIRRSKYVEYIMLLVADKSFYKRSINTAVGFTFRAVLFYIIVTHCVCCYIALFTALMNKILSGWSKN